MCRSPGIVAGAGRACNLGVASTAPVYERHRAQLTAAACTVHLSLKRMTQQPNDRINRGVAIQTLIAGAVATALCALTSQLGFVSRLAFVLAPSLLLLGVAGLVDSRILRAALKKPGESVAHLPRWAIAIGYLCWLPTLAV